MGSTSQTTLEANAALTQHVRPANTGDTYQEFLTKWRGPGINLAPTREAFGAIGSAAEEEGQPNKDDASARIPDARIRKRRTADHLALKRRNTRGLDFPITEDVA